jgi:hypothetical protein
MNVILVHYFRGRWRKSEGQSHAKLSPYNVCAYCMNKRALYLEVWIQSATRLVDWLSGCMVKLLHTSQVVAATKTPSLCANITLLSLACQAHGCDILFPNWVKHWVRCLQNTNCRSRWAEIFVPKFIRHLLVMHSLLPERKQAASLNNVVFHVLYMACKYNNLNK